MRHGVDVAIEELKMLPSNVMLAPRSLVSDNVKMRKIFKTYLLMDALVPL